MSRDDGPGFTGEERLSRSAGAPRLGQDRQGFEELIELLDQEGRFGQKILTIDYDTNAEGEAELGWLNASVHLTAIQPFDLDAFLLDVVSSPRLRV